MNKHFLKTVAAFMLDTFFPKFCFGCHHEGTYICQDCENTMGIVEYSFCLCKKPKLLLAPGTCSSCAAKNLDGLSAALPYNNTLTKTLIHYLKYEPFVTELSEPLASFIINHLQLIEKKKEDFAGFVVLPIPLAQKRMRWRGFNQSQEIAKYLAEFLEIPALNDVLVKTRETKTQIELSETEREQNVKGVFAVKNQQVILGKRILLIDDVYTTGSTMEEAAKTLKVAGAKEVWGMAVARG